MDIVLNERQLQLHLHYLYKQVSLSYQHLLIETDDCKSVKWRLFISIVNQTHLDTFPASPYVWAKEIMS